MRDDFTKATKQILAERVAWRCSNPDCRTVTVGPHMDSTKRVNVGQACHIEAASEGGPRYNKDMTKDERCSPENGIWLCSTHAREIDADPDRFSVDRLREWKLVAEKYALEELGKERNKEQSDIYTENINRHRKLFSHIRDMEYFNLYRDENGQCSFLRNNGLFDIIVKDRYIGIYFKCHTHHQLIGDFNYIDLLYLPVKDLLDLVVCSCEYDETIESFYVTHDFSPNLFNEIYFSLHTRTSNINPYKDSYSSYGDYTVENDVLRDDTGKRVPPSLQSIYLKIIVASYKIYRYVLTYKLD